MFLGASKTTPPRPATPGAEAPNPFQAQVTGGTAPAGPGVGAPRAELFTEALARRRRWAAHALGETPRRDGPFEPSAAGVALAMPPKARVEVRKDTAGLNPFQDS